MSEQSEPIPIAEPDQPTDRQRSARVQAGEEVLAMLEQPHIRDAFSKLEKSYVARMLKVPAHKRHDELRYRYSVAVEVLQQVVFTLTETIRDGKIEQANIERLDKFKRRNGLW